MRRTRRRLERRYGSPCTLHPALGTLYHAPCTSLHIRPHHHLRPHHPHHPHPSRFHLHRHRCVSTLAIASSECATQPSTQQAAAPSHILSAGASTFSPSSLPPLPPAPPPPPQPFRYRRWDGLGRMSCGCRMPPHGLKPQWSHASEAPALYTPRLLKHTSLMHAA